MNHELRIVWKACALVNTNFKLRITIGITISNSTLVIDLLSYVAV